MRVSPCALPLGGWCQQKGRQHALYHTREGGNGLFTLRREIREIFFVFHSGCIINIRIFGFPAQCLRIFINRISLYAFYYRVTHSDVHSFFSPLVKISRDSLKNLFFLHSLGSAFKKNHVAQPDHEQCQWHWTHFHLFHTWMKIYEDFNRWWFIMKIIRSRVQDNF